jgi:integrase
VHIGWQRRQNEPAGRWLLRRYLAEGKKYTVLALGRADDADKADGCTVLDFAQAKDVAAGTLMDGGGKVHRMTVRQAFDLYVQHQQTQGKPVNDLLSRGRAHILPTLGDKVVAELQAPTLRQWLATMAAQPAQIRPTSDGKPQWQAAPKTEEEKRKRMASANRVLNILKAMLNHAHAEGHCANADAWSRHKLKPFRNVEAARLRYLEVEEAKRLLNACPPDFRALVRAGLETGCRYSELTRLQVHDFNKSAGTVTVGKSKSGKARHVVLTEDGIAFFQQHVLGRDGNAPMFTKAAGGTWTNTDQKRRIDAACDAARIKPRITFHGLRHTWASLSVMNGVPLLVVARNLGHTDTRMVEKHYGHLAPSFITDAIRAGAPRFGLQSDKKVTPLRG